MVSLLLGLQEVLTGSPVPPSVQQRNSRPGSNVNTHCEAQSKERNPMLLVCLKADLLIFIASVRCQLPPRDKQTISPLFSFLLRVQFKI